MQSDLPTLSELNIIFKYADDTTLLVPQHTDIDISDEFDHIKTWARANKLILNLGKTKEIVLEGQGIAFSYASASIDNIEQQTVLNFLVLYYRGIWKWILIYNTFCQIQYILSQCVQRM